MVKIMDPSKISSSFYLKNNGPIHMHWELPQKLWAHPNSVAASIIKTMGPFNIIVSIFGNMSGPIQCNWQNFSGQQWAHSIISASAFSSISGPIQ